MDLFNPIGHEGTSDQDLAECCAQRGRWCRVKAGQAEGQGFQRVWAPCCQPSEYQNNPSTSHMIVISTGLLATVLQREFVFY